MASSRQPQQQGRGGAGRQGGPAEKGEQQSTAGDSSTAAAATAASAPQSSSSPSPSGGFQQPPPSQHAPSAAGSVIEATDGLGGTIRIRIQNISATANLGVRLDLKAIALRCRNTEFNPRRFAAVIMRLREPRATALIFASGKMCVTGTKSAHNSMLAAKKFTYIVEKVGFKPQDYIDFKIQNMVGTADVGFPIRLEGLVYAHSTFATYEPELFPGLIYRLVSPRVVFLIFVSGKVVITGAKTERDLSEALTKLHPVLVEYRKASVGPMPGTAAARARDEALAPRLSLPAPEAGGGGTGTLDGDGSAPRHMEPV